VRVAPGINDGYSKEHKMKEVDCTGSKFMVDFDYKYAQERVYEMMDARPYIYNDRYLFLYQEACNRIER